MKECDILGGQNILWPHLHIFSGSRPRNPRIYAHGYCCQAAFAEVTEIASDIQLTAIAVTKSANRAL